jgi:hypothetical protein
VTDVTDAALFVTDSQPPDHAQRDAVTDVTDKSQDDAPTANGHRTCAACGLQMRIIEPGQTTHPACD